MYRPRPKRYADALRLARRARAHRHYDEARRLLRLARKLRPTGDVEARMMGERSQRKGKLGERLDRDEWIALGYNRDDIWSRRELEAAGVETGIDYHHRVAGFGCQRKQLGKGNPLLRKAAQDEWDKCEQTAVMKGWWPVLHHYEGQGAPRKPRDLVVLRWQDFTWLVSKAFPTDG